MRETLTIAWGDEEVVGDSSCGPYAGSSFEIEVVIRIVKLALHGFVNKEIGCIRWQATGNDRLSTFPKP